jgi:hypothetical protein
LTVTIEYLTIFTLISFYQTIGNEDFKTLLYMQKEETQKKIQLLFNIYKVLPLIVIKYNLKTKKVKELNDSAKEILGANHNNDTVSN